MPMNNFFTYSRARRVAHQFSKLQRSILNVFTFFVLLLALLGGVEKSWGQVIYQHDFGTVAIAGKPYVIAPITLDPNLNTSSWTTSYTGFTNFGGATGQALSLAAVSGAQTYTLTFNVASGYSFSLSSFSFWRQRSTTGPLNWSMTVNGTAIGAGTVPTTGANTGVLTPSTTISGLNGTITIITNLTSGTGGTFRLDDFVLNGSVTAIATPDITLANNGTQIAAANVSAGTTAHILHQFQLGVTTSNATLTGINCTTAGSYIAADITNIKVRYSANNVLDAGDATLSTFTNPGAAGAKTFPAFTSQIINSTTTGYIFITADVAAGATVGNNISVNAIATGDLTFASGNKSGSTTAGGLQTFTAAVPQIVLADNGTQVAAANVTQGSTNAIVHKFQLGVTLAATNLTGLQIITAGSYIAADITNLKVRYSTDNALDAGDVTLSTFTNPGAAGTKTFPAFTSQAIAAGSTGYIFITADIAGAATVGNTISVNAVTTAQLTFSAGTKSGSTTAGGLQTFVAPSSSCATDLIFSEYGEGASNNKYLELYNGSGSSINLATYSIAHYNNGSATATYTLALAGTIAAGATYVIENSGEALGVTADLTTVSNVMTFNGDDAIALLKSGVAIDIIGEIGSDPGTQWGAGLTSTADNTIRRKATILAGDVNGGDAFDPAVEWDGYATDDVSGLGSHTMSCGPTLLVVPTSLTGFTYVVGSGPSTSQSYQLSGINLTGFPSTITVSGGTNYEVSLNNVAFGGTVNVSYTTATLAATTIWVRLKAGLAVGTYNGQLIPNAGGGATTVNVSCNGIVTGPLLTVTPTSLINLNYMFGAGPSAEQSYTISGINLTAGPITVTAPTNFEVSLTSGAGFANSVSVAYTAPTLAATTIYVRLKTALAINSYNGNVANSGGSANIVNVSLVGIVYDPAALPTVFSPGDMAIIGVNSNIKCIIADDGADEISFVAFKDINTGTTFYATDNGYQRANADEWGDTEGVYEFTRTGSTIPAGTVVTFRFSNIAPFMSYICPDAAWTFSKVAGFGGNLVMNTNGDQIYFMQGGTWNAGGGTHDATYGGGVYLFAFNSNVNWTDFGASTQQSGLIPGMECFSMMPGVATDFIKFTATVSGWGATTKRGWIDRVNDPANWTNCGVGSPVDPDLSCANYNAIAPSYPACTTSISISPAGFSPGVWTGTKDINWFNCENWQDLTIPDSTTNVTIPAGLYPNNPTIGDPPTVPVAYTSAYCNNISIAVAKSLTLNHANSKLNIFGNFSNDGSVSHTAGTVFLNGTTNTSFTASTATTLYNLSMVKKAANLTTTLGQDLTVNNVFTLTRGKMITGTRTLTIENNIPGAVIAGTGNASFATSYVIGKLKRRIASNALTYDFPVGIRANPRLAQFVNNSISPTTYLTANFDSSALVGNTGTLSVIEGTSTLTSVCGEGVWQIDPNVAITAGNYGLRLYFTGFTSLSASDNNAFTIVKRPNPAGLGDLGAFVNGGGSISGTNGAGRLFSDGYAYKWNLNAFSQFAIAKAGGPLPVELLSFTAECKGGSVMLSWQTATETNNDFFALERSADAKHFTKIAEIRGSGNSNELKQYTYSDLDPLNGISYYRLIQNDFDGNSETFGPVSAQCDDNYTDDFNIINITQNALNPVITYYIASNALVSCCIYDLNGRRIYCQDQDGESGTRILTIKTALSNGLYLIRLSDGYHNLTSKVFIR